MGAKSETSASTNLAMGNAAAGARLREQPAKAHCWEGNRTGARLAKAQCNRGGVVALRRFGGLRAQERRIIPCFLRLWAGIPLLFSCII
jgi:hypothetical protein